MTAETSERFRKQDRILKRGLFRHVYDGGRKLQARFFTAFLSPNDRGTTRLGITATRKMGNSVERNRARRLVREAYRKNKWLAPAGVDIVINVKRPLVEAGYCELEADFLAFLEKVSGR